MAETTTPGQSELPKTRLISYILLAEFDVDEGSILKQQYPRELVAPLSMKNSETNLSYSELIANMMHPDGSQRQDWDFNYFLLHRPPSTQIKEVCSDWEIVEENNKSQSVTLSDFIDDDGSNEPTLFAINTILCKLDKTVKRGATVRAISILSQYPAVSMSDGWATGIFPLVKDALLHTFDSEIDQTTLLSDLYNSINSLDIIPKFQLLANIPELEYSVKPYFLVVFTPFFILFLKLIFWSDVKL